MDDKEYEQIATMFMALELKPSDIFELILKEFQKNKDCGKFIAQANALRLYVEKRDAMNNDAN